jgi:hypothetical protein
MPRQFATRFTYEKPVDPGVQDIIKDTRAPTDNFDNEHGTNQHGEPGSGKEHGGMGNQSPYGNAKIFKCDICDSKKEIHSIPMKCEYCDFTSRRRYQMTDHWRQMHSRERGDLLFGPEHNRHHR